MAYPAFTRPIRATRPRITRVLLSWSFLRPTCQAGAATNPAALSRWPRDASPLRQSQSRKVRLVVPAVSGQQPVSMDSSMGADEEIGHDVLAWEELCPAPGTVNVLRSSARGADDGLSPSPQVLAPGPTCQVEGLGIRRVWSDPSFFQEAVQLFTNGETAS